VVYGMPYMYTTPFRYILCGLASFTSASSLFRSNIVPSPSSRLVSHRLSSYRSTSQHSTLSQTEPNRTRSRVTEFILTFPDKTFLFQLIFSLLFKFNPFSFFSCFFYAIDNYRISFLILSYTSNRRQYTLLSIYVSSSVSVNFCRLFLLLFPSSLLSPFLLFFLSLSLSLSFLNQYILLVNPLLIHKYTYPYPYTIIITYITRTSNVPWDWLVISFSRHQWVL